MKPSASWPIVDYSRYRVAESIVERFRAGETAASIGIDYGFEEPDHQAWLVELIVAAYDRRGMHRPTRGWR